MLQRLPQTVYVKAILVWLFVLPVLAATVGVGDGSALAASRPGFTYGGPTDQEENVFLRTSRNRRQLSRFYADWVVPASGCTNGQEYFGFTSLEPLISGRIGIRRGGRFTKRYIDDDKFPEGSLKEDLSLVGRIRAKRARGHFRVFVTERNAAGVVTNKCDTGRLRWSAVD